MAKTRQAVIIIHGIGEQRPFETLKKFVSKVIVAQGRDVRNKPDKMSLLFELRRLQLPRRRGQPQTDFYEYYWAHHMRDTELRMLLSWFRTLLWRRPSTVPVKLRSFYWLFWGMLGAALAALVFGFIKLGIGTVLTLGLFYFIDRNITQIGFGTIDDAARYLNPTPDNIDQRNQIRKEGIELLDALHRSKRYNRIVLVGHSLGSVIAYDLIRFYWATLEPADGDPPPDRTFLESWKREAAQTGDNIELFQQLQSKTWLQLRKTGYPWLINDLITIGSPLTHAEMLLAATPEEFAGKKEDGEYPCSPPVPDSEEIYYSRRYTLDDGTIRQALVPTSFTPFICVRWTNIFFPHRRMIMGDLIGGPLKQVFGPGIRDIEVGLQGLVNNTLVCHTRYWKFAKDEKKKTDCRHPTAEIAKYLCLDIEKGKFRLPEV